ncbi:SIS domain-containing protein [Candidatus Poribacteria bacterium]|nr:SIS domain-containing protein [Candidatus Poribacteria bacterium]
MEIIDSIQNALQDAQETLNQFLQDHNNLTIISDIATEIKGIFTNGGKLYTCGNGGSMCDAIHFAEECAGKFRKNRIPLPAIAFSDPGNLTCIANDFGFDEVFSRQVKAFGQAKDMLIVISTSGNSTNIIHAAETAKSLKMHVVGLLGKDGGKVKQYCDRAIIAPGMTADRIQEIHIKVIHILIEHIERMMFPENY